MRTALEIELSNSIDPGEATRMKAAVRSGYGSPSILRVEESNVPLPRTTKCSFGCTRQRPARTRAIVRSGWTPKAEGTRDAIRIRHLPINIASCRRGGSDRAEDRRQSRIRCTSSSSTAGASKGARAFAPLYVGQTAHSPEERFEQHKAGGMLAAAKPHRFGVRLRYDLMKGIGPFKTLYGSRSR